MRKLIQKNIKLHSMQREFILNPQLVSEKDFVYRKQYDRLTSIRKIRFSIYYWKPTYTSRKQVSSISNTDYKNVNHNIDYSSWNSSRTSTEGFSNGTTMESQIIRSEIFLKILKINSWKTNRNDKTEDRISTKLKTLNKRLKIKLKTQKLQLWKYFLKLKHLNQNKIKKRKNNLKNLKILKDLPD